ncbi:hypothetical protein AM588_10006337 [Phytophthora nicotianae]|uniref:Uncharacterized protein n=1 Tax=Phytophthora nicotianae TaxID=4792 RepID=A0A0W8D0L5_PHYNI|nr:hypothetical protein AM588_10006337 [Phytophthora nicotianae]
MVQPTESPPSTGVILSSSPLNWDGKCQKCRKLMSRCVCFQETEGDTDPLHASTALESDGTEELELTKEGFLKFRREYTSRKISLSDYDSSSEDDEGDLVGDTGTKEQRAPDDSVSSDANRAGSINSPVLKRLQSRRPDRGPIDNSSDHIRTSTEHELIVNPDELIESDESEGEPATNNQNTVITQQS